MTAPGRELPPTRPGAKPQDVAAAFRAAAEAAGLVATPELLALLLAQSAGETGHWAFCVAWNFGNAKASPAWIAAGGDYTYHRDAAPGREAPVSEWLPKAQAEHAIAVARPRTDGGEGMDAQVVTRGAGGARYMHFFPSHEQARFRAFETAEDGARAYLELLRDRFPEAVAAAARGDVVGFVQGLRARGYFTAPVEHYLRGVRSLYATYLPIAREAVRRVPRGGEARVFRSDPADLVIHPAGWERLPSGAVISRIPVWDEHHDIAGRPGWKAMEEWLAARGLRMPTAAEYEELHRIALFVEPHTMPTIEQLRAAGIPQTKEAINRFRNHHMMSLAWCREHDAEVWHRLAARGWDGDAPVANFGKHWAAGGIVGWWRGPEPHARKWQDFQGAHRGEPTHADYGTTTHAVIDDRQLYLASTWDVSPVAHHRLGLRCLAWMGMHLTIDPVEVPGPEHNELILTYSQPCRRGGRLVGIDDAGGLVWEGSGHYSTAAPNDEWEWCAIAASGRCLAECLLPEGGPPPHGARVAVRELVEDARAAGALHLAGSGYVPRPGDLAIEGRAGRSPLRGDLGHVWCVHTFTPGSPVAAGIGGNEGRPGRFRFSGQRPVEAVEAWIAR